jgi:isocitrate dehydrogenase kinase/phosphatase
MNPANHTSAPTPMAIALARVILNGFESFFADFQNITLTAKARFENADWQGVQSAVTERLDLYRTRTQICRQIITLLARHHLHDTNVWREAKHHYSGLIQEHRNYEIAETFFNSLFCNVFDHHHLYSDLIFRRSSHDGTHKTFNPLESDDVLRRYQYHSSLTKLLRELLTDYTFDLPWENIERDVRNIRQRFREEVAPRLKISKGLKPYNNTEFEVLRSIFYRNKAAYLVGRISTNLHSDERRHIPFTLCILNNEKGQVFVDTALFDGDELSIIFSFTRAYFMVDAAIPSQYVAVLKSLMPTKEISELYASIGFSKHGKTEFHRRAIEHNKNSSDQYIIAPGIKGMVMSVFTLPSYDYVFKVIRDRFVPPKDSSREVVIEKYRLVKRHDRVGRMADTQEFHNLIFARNRFSEELLEELHRECASNITEQGNVLILRHCYVERRMTPLNLYLSNATDEQVNDVMDEYGNAIKQLATANIFPGDMLLKNFGVTRHGRVIFYDYDEICYLTECHFRRIPEPPSEEYEMTAGPWYSVGPFDIFPEEFRFFFTGHERAKQAFDQLHADLYEVDFWRDLQEKIRNGEIGNVFPYRRKRRFTRRAD